MMHDTGDLVAVVSIWISLKRLMLSSILLSKLKAYGMDDASSGA